MYYADVQLLKIININNTYSNTLCTWFHILSGSFTIFWLFFFFRSSKVRLNFFQQEKLRRLKICVENILCVINVCGSRCKFKSYSCPYFQSGSKTVSSYRFDSWMHSRKKKLVEKKNELFCWMVGHTDSLSIFVERFNWILFHLHNGVECVKSYFN